MLPIPAYILQRCAAGLSVGFASGFLLTKTTHEAIQRSFRQRLAPALPFPVTLLLDDISTPGLVEQAWKDQVVDWMP